MKNLSPIIYNIALAVIALIMSNVTSLILLLYAQIIGNCIYLVRGNSKYISLGIVFFIVVSLFNYGAFLSLKTDAFQGYNQDSLLTALKFAFICIGGFCVGYYSKRNVYIDCSCMEIELSNYNITLLRKIAKIVLCISLPFLLYIDYVRITHTLTEGYVGLYSLGAINPIVRYGGFFSVLARPSVLFLMLSYYKDAKKARTVLICFIAYSLFSMISGARIAATTYILTFLLFYVKVFVKKISVSNIILLGAFVAFMIVFLPAISGFRTYGEVDTLSLHSDDIVANGGSAVAFASEFGDSFCDILLGIGGFKHYNFGMTYIVSFLAILPKVPEILVPITRNNFAFTSALPESSQMFLGGSCLAEAYYNFGFLAPVFFIIVGMIVCKIDENMSSLSVRNLFSCILCVSLVPCLIQWIRDFFICFMGEGFWLPVIYRSYLKNKIEK